jgi:hypothetical protein
MAKFQISKFLYISIIEAATDGILSAAREDQFDDGWIPDRSYESQIS